MIGNTITINNGAAKVLTLINQDGYSSEYLLKDSASEFRLKIRHSKTKGGANGVAQDRHNVELVEYVFPTEAIPLGRYRKFYYVIENDIDDTTAGVANADAICDLAIATANAFLNQLMGWQS